MAFGIMNSCAGVTAIIAPFTFGYGYNVSKSMGLPSLMLYIIAGLQCTALLILVIPLRLALKRMSEGAKNNTSLLETDLRTEQSSVQSYLSFEKRVHDSHSMRRETDEI